VTNGGEKMRAYPFLINQDTSGQRLQPIDIQERVYDETWLQDILQRHPDILPVAEIESVFYPLVPIGREVTTETGGAIDNLFISHRGYLVLVETKLWKNPEGKREVLAQAMDYGSSLSKWNYNRLNDVAKNYTKKYENIELDLVQWVEKRCGPVEGGRDFFEETVAKNLRLGRFLTLIVGDRIRQSLIEMLNYVNKYPHLATDVVLVELQCYLWTAKEKAWPLLVVPSIVARTEIVERSVVQITINQEGTPQIDVQQEKVLPKNGGRKPLTEEAFWELLKKQSPGNYESIRQLINEYRKRDGINIDPTESSIVVRLDIRDSGYQASTFYVTQTGVLGVWPQTLATQLEKAGLDRRLAEEYGTEMRNIMKMPAKRKEFSRPFQEVNLENFKSVVDTFIENVQLAKPSND
jgi:hypothetical protein